MELIQGVYHGKKIRSYYCYLECTEAKAAGKPVSRYTTLKTKLRLRDA